MTKDRRIEIGVELEKLNSVKEIEDYRDLLLFGELCDLHDTLSDMNDYGLLTTKQQTLFQSLKIRVRGEGH